MEQEHMRGGVGVRNHSRSPSPHIAPPSRGLLLILASPSLFFAPVKKKLLIYGSNWCFKLKLYFSAARQRGELSGSLSNSGNGSQTHVVSYPMYGKQNEGERLFK